MTAIAGCWSFRGSPDADAACDAMLQAQRSYGPDRSDRLTSGSLSAGRNLCRLLPEDEYDRQPLIAGDGRFLLVADLRLDNRGDLQAALGVGSRDAAFMADSELLLLALLRWDQSALERIVGDYAFAFHDSEQERLTLVRDPLGQRPLFWHRRNELIAFASMPSGLHALPGLDRRPNEDTVARYLLSLPSRGESSFYESINRVEPAHVLTWTGQSRSVRRHWSPQRAELGLSSFDDYVEAYRHELDQAVACRLRRSKPPICSHLSGGWDSSAVTATAARLLTRTEGRLTAFTAAPGRNRVAAAPWRRFSNELPLAEATAAVHGNVDHVCVGSDGASPIQYFENQFRLYGRPVHNPCNHVWLNQIRDGARTKGARVILTGDIGNWTISASPDTLLGDYLQERGWAAWWREARAARTRKRWRGIVASSFGRWVPGRLWRPLAHLSMSPDLAGSSAIHPALRSTFETGVGGGLHRDRFSDADSAFREMDFGEYRKGVLAGWGVDERDPTADIRLIRFCLSLPLEMLLKNGVRRPLARAALADRVPAKVLDETKKGYQSADWHIGLTADRKSAIALAKAIDAHPVASRLIDSRRLDELLQNWPRENWERMNVIADYRISLLQALAAGHFAISASSTQSA